MILGDSTATVELLAAPLGDGDFVFTVRAHLGGFAGAVDTIVTGAEWAAFLSALRKLEQRRQGTAELSGVAADDLQLWIASTSPAGHMAVRGELRNRSVPEGADLLLRFGPVAFDPGALPTLIDRVECWCTSGLNPSLKLSAQRSAFRQCAVAVRSGEWRMQRFRAPARRPARSSHVATPLARGARGTETL